MKLDSVKPSVANYNIYPQVVKTKNACVITIRPLGLNVAFDPELTYVIRIIPQEEIITRKTYRIGDDEGYVEIHTKSDSNGNLVFNYEFINEQIYTIRLLPEGQDRFHMLADLRVFAANEDLYERIPYKGNMHCHTMYSDGRDDPSVAASYYRKAGFDFVAITDHHTIDGSLKAIEGLRNVPSEFSVFCGEEVHVPNPYIHMVNFGARLDGDIGINTYYDRNKDKCEKEIAEIAGNANLPDNIDPMDFAYRKWCVDKIHQGGGIAIIAHPFWEYDAHNTSNAMLEYLIQENIFDGMELLSGQEIHSSEANMQVAFYNDLRARGLDIGIVGSDDAHDRICLWNTDSSFNKVFTIVFAKDNSFNSIAHAIKNKYSVAVDYYDEESFHVYGSYRLVKYAIFLLGQYFPFHDELCFEEGCRMKDCYLGDEDSRKVLNLINGRVKKFSDKFFGRESKGDSSLLTQD